MNWKRVELNKGGIDIGLNWEKRRIWKREESKKGGIDKVKKEELKCDKLKRDRLKKR